MIFCQHCFHIQDTLRLLEKSCIISMFHGILVPRRVLQRYEAPRGEPSTLHNFTFHVECVPSLSIILLEISILSRYISVAPRTTNCTCIASKICPPPL